MWLTFALPDDLLLAAVGHRGWVPSPDLLTPAVRDLLARGFAETHLHVGAALGFRTVWSLIQCRLASPGIGDHDLEAPGRPCARAETCRPGYCEQSLPGSS